MRVLILSCLVLTGPLSGCSLLFTSGPPPRSERGTAFACTTSFVAPVLDVAWVSYALAATSAEKAGGIDAGDAALGAVWIGSAVYGIWNVRRCRAAIDEAKTHAADAAYPFVRSLRSPGETRQRANWPEWTGSVMGRSRLW